MLFQGRYASGFLYAGLGMFFLLTACTPSNQHVVTKVIDGDTVEVTLADKTLQKIDLKFVDAPEREQPMGREASIYLTNNLLQQAISFDEHNRILLDDKPVAQLMIEKGLAWNVSEEAAFDVQLAYRAAQDLAIKQQIGLWGLEHALRVPPWEWRRQATQPSQRRMQRPSQQQ